VVFVTVTCFNICMGIYYGTLNISARNAVIGLPLTPVSESDKPKLALGGKAVHTGMDMKYKSAGAQPATVSQTLQWIVKV